MKQVCILLSCSDRVIYHLEGRCARATRNFLRFAGLGLFCHDIIRTIFGEKLPFRRIGISHV